MRLVFTAMGGATPYDFRINFCLDVPKLPKQKAPGEEIPPPKEIIVDRIEKVEIILSLRAMEELSDWLQKNIEGMKIAKTKKGKEVPLSYRA